MGALPQDPLVVPRAKTGFGKGQTEDGEGFEPSASSSTGRFTVLVPTATLAAILLWLIGAAADRLGLHEPLRPGSRKRCAYSRLFLARLLLRGVAGVPRDPMPTASAPRRRHVRAHRRVTETRILVFAKARCPA